MQILDYYHAAGHLAEFCDLLPVSMRDEHLRQCSTLLYKGEPLQLIVEMKRLGGEAHRRRPRVEADHKVVHST